MKDISSRRAAFFSTQTPTLAECAKKRLKPARRECERKYWLREVDRRRQSWRGGGDEGVKDDSGPLLVDRAGGRSERKPESRHCDCWTDGVHFTAGATGPCRLLPAAFLPLDSEFWILFCLYRFSGLVTKSRALFGIPALKSEGGRPPLSLPRIPLCLPLL